MNELVIQTKIDFEKHKSVLVEEIWNVPLQLNKHSILLYEKNKIIIFNKNLNSNELISFDFSLEKSISNLILLKNKKVLCCYGDLYIFTIKSSKIEDTKKIEIPNNETILDVIELQNGKILGITSKSIISIKHKDENYEVNSIYSIPNECLIEKDKFSKYFKQYFNIYELPNNKLLIHSHSTEINIGFCGYFPPNEVYSNKIFIFNLDNFNIIQKFYGNDNKEINIVILKKYICISYEKFINIYDIRNYKLIRQINSNFKEMYINKYNENIIFALSMYEDKNDIIFYSLENINDIKFISFKGKFGFNPVEYALGGNVKYSRNKSICKLKNGSIIIACNGRLYIVLIPGEMNSLNFESLYKY